MFSHLHPFWPLPLGDGELLLTPCPGTKEADVLASLKQLKAAGANVLVTLMTDAEMAEHNVVNIAACTGKMGLTWIHLPIEDENVPKAEFEQKWQACRAELHESLSDGGGVAIHCKGGSGRTGLIAARLMLEKGLSLEQIIPSIQTLRPRAFYFPAQREYIEAVADKA